MGALKVRIGLHTGTAEERDGDYFGPTINRVARLQAAGHGGQTLLTLATAELVRDALPETVSLRDLGERRLKDLIRPERIFQVVAPDLPAEFPALKTLDAHPTNLPAQPNAFTGRERELADVKRLLAARRLLTLTGPGGIGKTRLSLQAAADMIDDFEHGVYFVALAPISDANLVPSAIAQALKVVEAPSQSTINTLKSHLRDQKLLLVLDNFEQILEAAPLVTELLAAAPGLKVLVTSREELNLYGETVYAVPPLTLPDLKQRPPLPALTQYASVALFIDRAQAVNLDFHVDDANAAAVAEICVRLDGLPLAIELAAALCLRFSPEEILNQLSNRLEALHTGFRDLPARQRTLRGAIDWSYNLLNEDERRLFSALSVFVGGWTIPAVETVCAPLGLDVAATLHSLVDKNLVRATADQEPRFFMLETIQEYATERLEASGLHEALRERHGTYYSALTKEAYQQITGPQQAFWMDRLDTEHNNLRAAIASFVSRQKTDDALQICSSLQRFWTWRGHITEGRGWLRQALALPGGSPEVRALALYNAAMLAWPQQDAVTAKALLNESLRTSQTIDFKLGMARALLGLGIIANEQSEYAQADDYYQQSMALFQELNDPLGVQFCLNNLGVQAHSLLRYERALELYKESLAISQERGDMQSIAVGLENLAGVSADMGNYEDARRYAEEGLMMNRKMKRMGGQAACSLHLALCWIAQGDAAQARALLLEALSQTQEMGHRFLTAQAYLRLARVSLLEGDLAQANQYASTAVQQSKEIGNKQMTVDFIIWLAVVLQKQGHADQATRLLAGARAQFEALGAREAWEASEPYAGTRIALREGLAEPAFKTAWEAGSAYSFDQLVENALANAR
jgi:predicted ATPase